MPEQVAQKPRNILWNEYPDPGIAQFLSDGSRGIVETPDGKVYSYDNTRPAGQRFVEATLGFHPGMWLQPALSRQLGNPVQFRPSGDYPFTDLEAHLEQLAVLNAPGAPLWSKAHFDLFVDYDEERFARWLREGIRDWNDPDRVHLAFSPVQDRFSVNQPLMTQLIEMAHEMDPLMRKYFIEGAKRYRDETHDRGEKHAAFADDLFSMVDLAA